LEEDISRIAGGTLSFRGEFPSLVSLQVLTNTGEYVHVCGGTIIDEQHVLTAAHCFLGG
jgi:secreted trypsin-like serine protease